ncbi:MAG: peptidase M1, partial [Gemmatimonadota bacterium]
MSEARLTTASVMSLVAMPVCFMACELTRPPDTSPGVSWTLASERAHILSEVRYEIQLTIPDSIDQRIAGQVTIRLRLNDADRPLVLDFEQPRESIIAVRVGDSDVAYEFRNGHIVLPASALEVGENVIEIEFLAGDASLNRNREFLYTLFVPDRARFALPCFDQPDLKAHYRLTLDVPASWQAVANGAVLSHETTGDRAVFRFAESEPISTYLFAFAAGEFQVVEVERGGRAMRMYHRETDSVSVARNTAAIFDLHAGALDWLEAYTGIEYPFGKFDFVLIPSFQYGGMEHPGTIFYRASRLLLDESATQNEELGRASLIA